MPMRIIQWLGRLLKLNTGVRNDVIIQTPEPSVIVLASFQLNLLELHNSYRVDNGLPILKIHASLNNSAQGHATWMAKVKKLTHFGLKGEIFKTREESAGYKLWSGGENLAYGYMTEEEVFKAWIQSYSHRSNILSPIFTDVGFGCAKAENGKCYWVTDFGSMTKEGVPLFNSSGTLTQLPSHDGN